MKHLIEIEKLLENKEREAIQRRDYQEAGRLGRLSGKFTTLRGVFAIKKPTMADTFIFAVLLEIYKITI